MNSMMMGNQRLHKKADWKKGLFIFGFLLIPLIHFAVFTLYVNISALVMAFQRYDGATNTISWDLTYNFALFFRNLTSSNDMYRKMLLNSVLYFPVVDFIMLPLSVISAYFLFRKIKFSKVFRFIFFLPNIIPIVVLSIAFRNMWDPSFGPVNLLLQNVFGVPQENLPAWLLDPNYAMGMLYFYAVWAGIGYNVILLNGAMQRIPPEIFESARMDGIGSWREI